MLDLAKFWLKPRFVSSIYPLEGLQSNASNCDIAEIMSALCSPNCELWTDPGIS
jgi:hypothetical protein